MALEFGVMSSMPLWIERLASDQKQVVMPTQGDNHPVVPEYAAVQQLRFGLEAALGGQIPYSIQ